MIALKLLLEGLGLGFLLYLRGKNGFDQKEIDKYVRGAERSKKREYPMDWVFDFSYDLSVPEYYVTHRECGVCKIGQQGGTSPMGSDSAHPADLRPRIMIQPDP